MSVHEQLDDCIGGRSWVEGSRRESGDDLGEIMVDLAALAPGRALCRSNVHRKGVMSGAGTLADDMQDTPPTRQITEQRFAYTVSCSHSP